MLEHALNLPEIAKNTNIIVQPYCATPRMRDSLFFQELYVQLYMVQKSYPYIYISNLFFRRKLDITCFTVVPSISDSDQLRRRALNAGPHAASLLYSFWNPVGCERFTRSMLEI